jgi:hypothetical protein
LRNDPSIFFSSIKRKTEILFGQSLRNIFFAI